MVKIDRLAKRDFSKGLVSDYKPFTMVDGEGWRCSIYVSGCVFNCKGCYNKSIQDFGVGKPYTEELENQIINDLSKPYIQGLTLLGGEPFLNTKVCLSLVNKLRDNFGDSKDIWSWTGYTYEELLESIDCDTVNSRMQKELLNKIDILVDGRFVQEQFDTTGKLKFRGSWNQRIIDMNQTRATGRVILWEE